MATNTHSIDLEKSSNQYLSIADAAQTGLDLSGDFTIEFWIQWESIISAEVLNKYDSVGNQRAYVIEHRVPENVLNVVLSSDGTSSTTVGVTFAWNPVLGTWYHLAFAYDASAGTVTVYQDGNTTPIATLTGFNTSIFNSSAAFAIGGASAGGSTFDGKFDDVRVWSILRTATEIANNYDKQLAGTETGLEGYWRLNNDLTDETSNGNTLTNNNSAVFSTDVPFAGIVEINVSDTTSVADLLAKETAKTFSDSLTTTDNASGIKIQNLEVADSFTAVDSLTKLFSRSLTDSTSLTDNVKKTLSRTLSDLVSTLDNTATLLVFNRTISDQVRTADSISRTAVFQRSIDDTIAMIDDVIAKNLWEDRVKPTTNWTKRTL